MDKKPGRPKVGLPKSVCFTEAQEDFLSGKGGNVSEVIRRIIESARLKEGHKWPRPLPGHNGICDLNPKTLRLRYKPKAGETYSVCSSCADKMGTKEVPL